MLERPWLWLAAAVIVLAVVGGTLLFRQSTTPASPPATASGETSSPTVQPAPAGATVAVPSLSTAPPDETEQAKMGAALEAVEQARQQKSVEPVMTAPSEAPLPAQRRPANPPASRVNEWQVTENHTRKVH